MDGWEPPRQSASWERGKNGRPRCQPPMKLVARAQRSLTHAAPTLRFDCRVCRPSLFKLREQEVDFCIPTIPTLEKRDPQVDDLYHLIPKWGRYKIGRLMCQCELCVALPRSRKYPPCAKRSMIKLLCLTGWLQAIADVEDPARPTRWDTQTTKIPSSQSSETPSPKHVPSLSAKKREEQHDTPSYLWPLAQLPPNPKRLHASRPNSKMRLDLENTSKQGPEKTTSTRSSSREARIRVPTFFCSLLF